MSARGRRPKPPAPLMFMAAVLGTTATSVQEPTPVPGTYQYQIGLRMATGQQGLSQWVPYFVPAPPVVLPPPPGNPPTIVSNGALVVGLSVTGTPTTATVTWGAASGAVNYRVNRGPVGTTNWTAVTPAPITALSVSDVVPDPRQTYTYSILAYQPDGRYGDARVDFTAPRPTNPTGLAATVTGTAVALSWSAVQFASAYTVSGPGIAGTVRTPTPTYTVAAAPPGTNVYRVGSVFDPGGLQTAKSAFPSVVARVQAPATCACATTGPFTAPGLNPITGGGLTGTVATPSGMFRLEAKSVAGAVMLDIYDSQNRPVLSATHPSAWGTSPDGRYFAVAFPEPSLNTGAPISVYRIGTGSGKWPIILDATGYADGRWGFSAEGTMFILTRIQSGPDRFSFQAFNLLAPNPKFALVQMSEAVWGGSVTVSPCGDRLMYFRWTDIRVQTGQALFYRRTGFGGNSSPVIADWDYVSPTPAAGIVAGPGSFNFLVQLSGLKTQGQTTFASLQCAP